MYDISWEDFAKFRGRRSTKTWPLVDCASLFFLINLIVRLGRALSRHGHVSLHMSTCNARRPGTSVRLLQNVFGHCCRIALTMALWSGGKIRKLDPVSESRGATSQRTSSTCHSWTGHGSTMMLRETVPNAMRFTFLDPISRARRTVTVHA
jgi:hypothetical protein